MSETKCTPKAHPGELEIDGSLEPCSYLPEQSAKMAYRLAQNLSESRYEELLERGWRRFGRVLFRPNCPTCTACTGIRVPALTFHPSKSQRRCLKTFSDLSNLTLTIQKPTLSPDHIHLYNHYHLDMHHRRQWPFREITRDQYFESFLEGHFPFSREFQYRLNDQLIAVGLVDITANAMSSIYFYHSPEWRNAGIGTYSVLKEIHHAQELNRNWLYLGYYIRECPSMNYKNSFRPHQLLQQFPDDQQSPIWDSPAACDAAR